MAENGVLKQKKHSISHVFLRPSCRSWQRRIFDGGFSHFPLVPKQISCLRSPGYLPINSITELAWQIDTLMGC